MTAVCNLRIIAKKCQPPKSHGYRYTRLLEESAHACNVLFVFLCLFCDLNPKLYKMDMN